MLRERETERQRQRERETETETETEGEKKEKRFKLRLMVRGCAIMKKKHEASQNPCVGTSITILEFLVSILLSISKTEIFIVVMASMRRAMKELAGQDHSFS